MNNFTKNIEYITRERKRHLYTTGFKKVIEYQRIH